jgi:hypothetical protein
LTLPALTFVADPGQRSQILKVASGNQEPQSSRPQIPGFSEMSVLYLPREAEQLDPFASCGAKGGFGAAP